MSTPDGAPHAGRDAHLPDRLDVAVIGPGRVGTTLALALTRAGHRVVAVAGGGERSRQRFHGAVAGVRDTSPAEAAERADLLLVTTPDDAVEAVVTSLVRDDVLAGRHRLVHTAGALGLEPLRRAALAGSRVAACHPAQTFPASPARPRRARGCGLGGHRGRRRPEWAHELVTALGGTPYDLPDARRTLYHAALTVGSNAVAAAVSVARQLLLAAGIDDVRRFLAPLVEASAGNVLTSGAHAITGPVVRG